MQTQTFRFPIEQIVSHIFDTGELSRADRHQLQSMLQNNSINETELSLIERVMEGVVQGILDVLY
ncbi:MAG: hypothetical protein HC786_30440 [Richelia sp. CSU_2_1]|nr:hypothetical protein [Microcoleus sp. SU_5_3]NJR26115.1 hypothetical protein [Richelia sp. CSU_2_1]